MGKKRAVTLYIEEDIVDEMKARNYNISYLCSEAMKLYITEDLGDVEISTRLSAMDLVINEARAAMIQKQLEYDEAKSEYDRTVARRRQMEADFIESQKTVRLSRMIRELNKHIIAMEYNTAEVELVCANMIEQIRELSPIFDLKRHVTRLKNVLS